MANAILLAHAAEAASCEWCKSPLNGFSNIRESVCDRCYSLLSRANLADSEIFDPNQPVSSSPLT